MQKNTNYLSHVTYHSPLTCHILKKNDNSGMTCGVKNSNFGFSFEARTKSSHDVREKCIFSDVMLGIRPSFKN